MIHYDPAAKEIPARSIGISCAALGDDVTVHVVCPSRPAFDELTGIVGQRMSARTGSGDHPITTWSRDRWVALARRPAEARPPSGVRAAKRRRKSGRPAGDELVGTTLRRRFARRCRRAAASLVLRRGRFSRRQRERVRRAARAATQHPTHGPRRTEFLRQLAATLHTG